MDAWLSRVLTEVSARYKISSDDAKKLLDKILKAVFFDNTTKKDDDSFDKRG